MRRLIKENINTIEYWKSIAGRDGYRSNIRKSGLTRYESVFNKLDKNLDILEVGCGLGDFYGYLKERNFEMKSYKGFDLSPKLIEMAKSKFPETEWFSGDCHLLPFPDEYFDSLVSMQMLEHIDGLWSFLMECHRVLRENGKIYLTVPNEFNIRHSSHCWYFDKYDIESLLMESYFKDCHVFTINNNSNLLGIGQKKYE
jgi:ubiquinone/menaquinone biosynthesis C-methylase UbiE